MACTLLNQIFYNHKKFDTPEDIHAMGTLHAQ